MRLGSLGMEPRDRKNGRKADALILVPLAKRTVRPRRIRKALAIAQDQNILRILDISLRLPL